jgi:hypothetical protein
VKVRHSEGVAIHIDPESCAGYCREAAREALTGGRTGEVLSGESNVVRGVDAVVACRRQQAQVRHREDLGHPASSLDSEHVRASLARQETGRSSSRPGETVRRAASGRPEAIADDERGEEVRLIDSTCEAGEQAERSAAESVEGDDGTKRNAELQSTVRTQS